MGVSGHYERGSSHHGAGELNICCHMRSAAQLWHRNIYLDIQN